ncbi:MAG TPA: hypothetical protein VFA27_17160 [Vicinamibacterales bacterium]|nr:hypothetical protein [Vicinamibacterales bacterium]
MFAALLAVSLFAQSPQYPILDRDLEVELALSAAPAHVRPNAAVWVLEASGFVLARPGTNAFSCLVARRDGDLFPICWDAEGAASLLPIDFDDARLRLAGKSGADIDALVKQRFADGQYHAPARPGVSYMLSPLRYRIDERGGVTKSPANPHVMFYGPNLRDADIGGVRGSYVFMNKVGPDGMMIVPVGATEREAIIRDSDALRQRLEAAIGFRP